MSTNITPQKNRKSNIRNPRKFKIRDTFWTDHVHDPDEENEETEINFYEKLHNETHRSENNNINVLENLTGRVENNDEGTQKCT